MAGLPQDEGNRQHEIDGEREDLRAQNRPANALNRCITPAQLRTPPELSLIHI